MKHLFEKITGLKYYLVLAKNILDAIEKTNEDFNGKNRSIRSSSTIPDESGNDTSSIKVGNGELHQQHLQKDQ